VFVMMNRVRCEVMRELLDEPEVLKGGTGCDVMLLIILMPSITVSV
jgi:hypothetical protein